MVRDPEAAKRLMQEQVVGTAHSKVQNAVSDIQNKYAAILNLENSVNDLLELFSEMALLIERNGELIDKVETNFDDAHSYVEQTEATLANTQQIHKKNEKLSCCIMITMTLIILVVVCWLFKLF